MTGAARQGWAQSGTMPEMLGSQHWGPPCPFLSWGYRLRKAEVSKGQILHTAHMETKKALHFLPAYVGPLLVVRAFLVPFGEPPPSRSQAISAPAIDDPDTAK